MQRKVGAALQLVGLAAVTAGVWLLAVWAGVIVAGVSVFAVGFQLEAENSEGRG